MEVKRDINILWQYPSSSFEDICVWEEKIDNTFIYYNVSIEGYIFYETIEDGINYIKEMKNNYLLWLKKNYDIDELIKDSNKHNKSCYISYDIEIIKDELPQPYSIYLNAPTFFNLYDIYLWLDGVINQLKTDPKICNL